MGYPGHRRDVPLVVALHGRGESPESLLGPDFGLPQFLTSAVGHGVPPFAIAAADVGAMAERRTDRLLDASRSAGLPPFLADDPGSTPGS